MTYVDLGLTFEQFNFLMGLTGLICSSLIVYAILKRF